MREIKRFSFIGFDNITDKKGAKMARKKKITPELIQQAGEFAHSGFSDKQIYEAPDISSSSFYANPELVEAVKTNKEELRRRVADALLETAVGGDTTALIFLSKRLGLHQSINYKKGKLKTPKDATIELEKLYHASVSGDAPLELINAVGKIINDFVRVYEVSDIEERIEELEADKKRRDADGYK